MPMLLHPVKSQWDETSSMLKTEGQHDLTCCPSVFIVAKGDLAFMNAEMFHYPVPLEDPYTSGKADPLQ